jgi:hypothetical protein
VATLNTGYRIQDTGYGIQNTGYGIRDTEANPTSVKR